MPAPLRRGSRAIPLRRLFFLVFAFLLYRVRGMQKAQDAGILSIEGLRSVGLDRLMQIAVKAAADPKAGKKSA